MDPSRSTPSAARRRGAARGAGLAVLVTAVVLAGCSASATSSSTTAAATRTASTTTCRPPATGPVRATPVPGVSTDWTVTSFDGTQLRAHWFPVAAYRPGTAGGTHPTVLMGPGWGEAGDTDTGSGTASGGPGILSALPISDLLDAGYNVLTWDPRGFGRSGGTIEVDSPSYEARDVSVLLSWVATRPGVELDAPGDPRTGMVGASYGGGIQLVTAATDCRVDAIVPIVAWHSLVTSLDKAGLVKAGWAGILQRAAAADHPSAEEVAANAEGVSTGAITPAQRAWFAARGPAGLVHRITAPTLIIQGTVDNLFTLQEGVDNYGILRAAGTPVAMQWFCGGHGVCLTDPGDTAAPAREALAWLSRYVQRDTSVDLGPGFVFVDQNGTGYAAPSYPLPLGRPFVATGSGTLPLVATGGSGPVTDVPADQTLGPLVAPVTPAPATTAVDVPVPFPRTGLVVGAPSLTLTYHGTVPAHTRPTVVFAQLVDTATGRVLGNQVTPVDVTLDGGTHTTRVPLEIVAYAATPASHVELQLVATTVAYAPPQLGGSVTFTGIHLALPVAAPGGYTG